jgi:ribosomal protein L11 methylase PrmA
MARAQTVHNALAKIHEKFLEYVRQAIKETGDGYMTGIMSPKLGTKRQHDDYLDQPTSGSKRQKVGSEVPD